MEIGKAIDLLTELHQNAVDLKDEEHEELFDMAMCAIQGVYERDIIMKVDEKLLIEEFGEKWYHEHVEKLSKESFKQIINGMAESEFKNFLVENFDQITGGSFEDMRLE